ncbi:MAG: porin family protein [Gammaproteobacteria bacterium]|nr:porin family protein [Gammaproteobacteria bacterium]NIR83657.1 porin family protein [Gammaproteobacteria bacterium]NIR91632.1 porin family protein [Gammaproteobacteria bacterium]NIU04819.1 porin family protein [Gammaproteobacteria bacterium]NIV51805.1 outer membrane beta-barrel protein [Gammaproteobacteria bacterium]
MKAASCAIFGLTLLGLVSSPASAEAPFIGTDAPGLSPEYDAGLFLNRPDVLDIRVRHLEADAPQVTGGTLGYRFRSRTALDLELEAYQFAWDHTGEGPGSGSAASGYGPDVGLDALDLALTTMSLNARYRLRGLRTSDFPDGRLQPYAGVSVGTFFRHLRSRRGLWGFDETLGEDDTRLDFQGFLGSTYFLSRETALFAQYKLRHTQKLDFDLGNSGVELGLRANEWTSFELDLSSDEWRGAFKLNF